MEKVSGLDAADFCSYQVIAITVSIVGLRIAHALSVIFISLFKGYVLKKTPSNE